MAPRQTLTHVTCAALQGLREDFQAYPPQLVLVQGDTTTAFAAGFAAFYEQIPVGHVEAGLRTDNLLIFQAYDFYFLNKNHNCSIQMGGSDQWGNITSGVELTRKKLGIKVHALTCPLITKADGTKFGKTEEGNVWLDRDKTSPYKFYQYWLNTSDEDAIKYLKIFSFMNEASVTKMIEEHSVSPHLRLIQKQLASELTKLVHSEEDLKNVIFASNIIFSKESKDNLSDIDEKTLLQIFDGLPVTKISSSDFQKSENIENVLMNSSLFNSFSDLRRALKENSVSVNRKKIDAEAKISGIEIIKNKYIIVQRGKKKYSLLILE